MGLLDKLRGILGSTESSNNDMEVTASENVEGVTLTAQVGTVDSDIFSPPEDSVDLDYLETVIEEFYEITRTDARLIAESVYEGYMEGYGYDKVARHAKDAGVEIDRDEIQTIVWTETSGLQTQRIISKFYERIAEGTIEGVEWSVPDDERGCSPVCESTQEAIDNQGGSVSVDELYSLLKEFSEKYDDGTPSRIDDWIPHKECRSTVMAALDY